jgi:hypothetical protein
VGESTSRDPRSSFQAVTARPLATRPSNYGWSGGTISYGRNTGEFCSTREAGACVPSLLPKPFRPEEEGWQPFHIPTIQYLKVYLLKESATELAADLEAQTGLTSCCLWHRLLARNLIGLKLRGAGSRFTPRRTSLMASDRFALRHRHCRQSEAESAAAGRSTSAISSRKSRKRCCARPARRRPKRCKGNRTVRRSGRRHQANCSAESAGRRSHGHEPHRFARR